jgi:hypothetical protein
MRHSCPHLSSCELRLPIQNTLNECNTSYACREMSSYKPIQSMLLAISSPLMWLAAGGHPLSDIPMLQAWAFLPGMHSTTGVVGQDTTGLLCKVGSQHW